MDVFLAFLVPLHVGSSQRRGGVKETLPALKTEMLRLALPYLLRHQTNPANQRADSEPHPTEGGQEGCEHGARIGTANKYPASRLELHLCIMRL